MGSRKEKKIWNLLFQKIHPQDPPTEQLIASSPPPKRPAGAGGGPTQEKNTRQGLKHSITRGHKVEDCESRTHLARKAERETERESKTDQQIILLRVGRTSSYQTKKRQSPPKYPRPSSRLGGGRGTGSLGRDEDKQRDVCEVEMLS